MRIISFSKIVLYFCFSLAATAQEIEYIDKVYQPDILSTQFHILGLPTSEPIIDLDGDGQLILSFDDLLGGQIDYGYRIVHCDKDWNPSNISEIDYLEGFNDERIENYQYSRGTKYDYTNYQLVLPNSDTGWKVSGNYLLVVSEEDTGKPIITRRFLVTENKVSIGAEISRSRKIGRLLKDHELEITIDHSRFPLQNAQSETFISIIQNGRWDHSFNNLKPITTSGNILQFNRTQQLSFPAYNEFRGVDARSYLSRGFGIEQINIEKDEITLFMYADLKRDGLVNTNLFEDINGHFIIESRERNFPHYGAEYVNINFALSLEEKVKHGDIYIIGDFNDWAPKEEFRMTYDSEQRLYTTTALLKQGYYDYQYMIVNDDQSTDIEYIEGSFYGTENRYHILVYLRKFGERFDRLIGVRSISSTF